MQESADTPPSESETRPREEGSGDPVPEPTQSDGTNASASPSGERILERFMASVRKPERPKRRAGVPPRGSTDVLKKWVEGDDSALESWIQSSDRTGRPDLSAPGTSSPVALIESRLPARDLGAAPAGPPPGVAAPISAEIEERQATLVRWLTDLLDRVKTEQFDPRSLVQELQESQQQLYDERAKRKQMEEELEHVKRGSIAVIKYVRTREAKAREQATREMEAQVNELKSALAEARTGLSGPEAPPVAPGDSAVNAVGLSRPGEEAHEIEGRLRAEFESRESGFLERETDLRRRQIQLEEEVRNLRSELELARKHAEAFTADEQSLTETLRSRMNAADLRERELARRENEIRSKFEEIRLSTEELERRRQPLEYKEKELIAWEQEIRVRKQAVDLQARKVEEAKVAGASPESIEQMKRLADLQAEISKKESELKAREQFLHQRMQELEGLEGKAAQAEADRAQEEIRVDTAQAKLRTGVRRLDDLLFGGIPIGSQLLVSGPAHTGKDVLARAFITEGLKQGAGVIWVLTDKSYQTVRDEAQALLPAHADYEKKGLVRYIDLYSRSLGITEAESNVVLLSTTDKSVLDQLTTRVNEFAQEFKQKAVGYRLVFESISTVTAYLDTTAAFRFLQPFVGRRKVDGAIGYYLIESGMHTESDIRTLEHMMDGSIHLKIDQLKNFLSVRGVTDVQSRAWVGYTFSKRSFSLGSFSLDHIR
jgi:KaiC/GvpD/RAD55 family RecA-like ATPase